MLLRNMPMRRCLEMATYAWLSRRYWISCRGFPELRRKKKRTGSKISSISTSMNVLVHITKALGEVLRAGTSILAEFMEDSSEKTFARCVAASRGAYRSAPSSVCGLSQTDESGQYRGSLSSQGHKLRNRLRSDTRKYRWHEHDHPFELRPR